MHSKQKGNIGVATTVLKLQKHGLNVFFELGDYSKIDLIAELHGKLRTIQVKYANNIDGKVMLPISKSGPNGYKYIYKTSDIDWFAAYDSTFEKVYWVKSSEALKNKNVFVIRTAKSKNNMVKRVNFAENYTIDKFLDDFSK